MKAIDLLSPNSKTFNGEKISKGVPPAEGTFDEVLAGQEQQIRRKTDDQRDDGPKGSVGILTDEADRSLPEGEDSFREELNPANPPTHPVISSQSSRTASDCSEEPADQWVNAALPEDQEGTDRERAGVRCSHVAMVFVAPLSQPECPGSAGIEQYELLPTDPVIAVTHSGNADSDPGGFFSASSGFVRVSSPVLNPGSSSAGNHSFILPTEGSDPSYRNEARETLSETVAAEETTPSSPSFMLTRGTEKTDTGSFVGMESFSKIEKNSGVSPDMRTDSSPIRARIENSLLGNNSISTEGWEKRNAQKMSPYLVPEGKGLSFSSSPDGGKAAGTLLRDVKADSFSPEIGIENPLFSRNTLSAHTSEKDAFPGNPPLPGKGTDGFSFPFISEKGPSTDEGSPGEHRIFSPGTETDALAPGGVLPSQAGTGPADGRREDFHVQTHRLDTANPEEISRQISRGMVRSFSRHGQTIEIALEPPELGNLFIEVKREKGGLKAILWTDNPQTRSMIENHQAHLHKLLREDGLALEEFDVLFHQDTRSFHERASVSHQRRGEMSPKKEGISALDPLELPATSGRIVRSGAYSLDVLV